MRQGPGGNWYYVTSDGRSVPLETPEEVARTTEGDPLIWSNGDPMIEGGCWAASTLLDWIFPVIVEPEDLVGCDAIPVVPD